VASARGPAPEELRAKAQQLRQQLETLKSQGNEEAARQVAEQLDKLRRHAAELRERAEQQRRKAGPQGADPRRQMAEKMEAMKRRIHELAKAGKKQEAEQMERQLRQMMERMKHHAAGRPGHPHPEQHPEKRLKLGAEAVHHLQQAAAKLQAAGMPEPAQHVRQIAERIGQEVRKQTHAHQAHQVIGKLREEVMRLRKDVDQLKAGR